MYTETDTPPGARVARGLRKTEAKYRETNEGELARGTGKDEKEVGRRLGSVGVQWEE